jgi:hypothetical protein
MVGAVFIVGILAAPVSMRRAIIHVEVVKQRLDSDGIGYIRLTEFTEQAEAGLKQAVKPLRHQARSCPCTDGIPMTRNGGAPEVRIFLVE